MVSAQARREQVDYAVGRGASVRRACALLQVSRSSLGYESRIAARDAVLLPELLKIAQADATYGYRFVWALLKRDGHCVNVKRVRRMWRRYGLTVRRRRRATENPDGEGAGSHGNGAEHGVGLRLRS